ncbi:hypothetical protein LEP1GSC060_0118 [Leptospira weilii serovar Ranarum str. ICFT]|uniref:Uncharacterized protein n=1 Tax=Leptospira weilii serovar Ranarum str. ICFT TaxID=1218598 RepID=N1WJF2_9LEPT|nr:hypothetical protein LEP1GSC060_0118 [Leptospira weilii serovar Ranarum str. ICFT]
MGNSRVFLFRFFLGQRSKELCLPVYVSSYLKFFFFFVNPIRCDRVKEPLRVWTFFYFLARKKFNPL